MDKAMKRLTERLAMQSSRSTFLRTLGKAALGAAAIASGQGLNAALAASPDGVPLYCCSGSPCQSESCPGGGNPDYGWACCVGNPGTGYFCYDCPSGCTYAVLGCTYCVRTCPCNTC